MRLRSKEWYEAMDAFERWMRSRGGVYVSSLEREDKSMWPTAVYRDGMANALWRAWLAGMSYQRCLDLE